MGQAVLTCGAAVWAYMTAWFLAALALKDNSLADLAWGPGFCLAAALTLFLKGDFAARQILVSTLVLVWGFRLALHILLRKRGRGEDFRYAEWRRKWGRLFVVRSYLQVFMLQGIFLLVISLPVIRVNSAAQGPLGIVDVVGAAIWLSGFAFEAVADRQLAVFKGARANQGRLMTSGLWRYSRHPNYFGEAAMWWGLFVFALDSPAGWLTVASPLLITVLLVWVSGVPLLERKYRGRPDFEAYARRTSVFVPWFPKSRDR
jgi:steroid 5-alpha reductase family enzyme